MKGKPNCPDCKGTGWSGDLRAGIRGNNEYAPCDCVSQNVLNDLCSEYKSTIFEDNRKLNVLLEAAKKFINIQ